MAKAGRGSDQFMVRLPDGLREQIRRHAEHNGRSMNSEVVSLIEYGLWEADMARMQAGLEPFREATDEDWEIIHHARKITAKSKEPPNSHSKSDGVPFFDDERPADGDETEPRIYLTDRTIDESEFSRVLAEENRKAFAAAMQRLGVKMMPLDTEDENEADK